MRKATLVFGGLIALYGIIFYWSVLTGSSSFYLVDITQFSEPLCRYIAERYRQGFVPLWNPYLYCGMAQIAVQSPGLCYLPNLLFVLFPFGSGLALNLIFSQVVAGVGGFLLVCQLGWGRSAAITAAVLLAWNGFMFSMDNNYTLAATSAWLPLAMFFIHRIVCKNVVISGAVKPGLALIRHIAECETILLAVAGYLCLTAGRPEILLPGCLLIAVFTVYCLIMESNSTVSRLYAAACLLVAGLVALLLSMPMLLPAWEWLSVSRRAKGLYFGEIFMLSGTGYDLSKLWLWPVLGDQRLNNNPYMSLSAESGSLFLASSFVGPIVLIWSIIALSDTTWRPRWLVFFGIVLAVVLCLGNHTPLAPALFQALPILQIVRFPVKSLAFLTLGFSLAAARGVHRIELGVSKHTLSIASAWAFLIIIAGVFAWYQPISAGRLLGFPITSSLLKAGVRALALSQIWLFSWALIYCLLSLFVPEKRKKMVLRGGIGLTIFFLMVNSLMIGHHWAKGRFFSKPSVVLQAIRRFATSTDTVSGAHLPARVTGLYHRQFFLEPPWLLSGNADASAVLATAYSRQMLEPNTNLDFSSPSAWGFEAASNGDYYKTFITALAYSTQSRRLLFQGNVKEHTDEPLARFMRNASVPFVLSQCFQSEEEKLVAVPLLDRRFFQLLKNDEYTNLRIYRVRTAYPRVRLAHDCVWMNHADSLKSYFLVGGELDADEPVILEPVSGQAAMNEQYAGMPQPDRKPSGKSLSDQPRSSESQYDQFHRINAGYKEPPKGQPHINRWPNKNLTNFDHVLFLQDDPEQVTIATHSQLNGWLVLADQYYSGWIATIDGKQVDILRANAFFRAVWLPKGDHTVIFTYRPLTWYGGLLLASLGLLGIIVMLTMHSLNHGKVNLLFQRPETRCTES